MKLKEYLVNCVKTNKVPGICVAYINEKDNYFLDVGFKGYIKYLGESYPVDQNTLYDLASLTKVVCTTTLILKLIEDHYFSLETRVQDILPDFKYANISIKDLLTHTSGLPADDKKYKECVTEEEMWQFVLNEPLVYETGSKVEYSDFGYIILGKVIEHFKFNIAEYANEVIFKPLGMNHTMFKPKDKGFLNDCAASEISETRGVIRGEVHDGKAFKLGGISGNAGLFSTTRDLTKFVSMMLDDGYPILKKETIKSFKSCQTKGLNLSRTIGWFFNDETTPVYGLCSNCSLWHTGFAGGSILIDYEKKCGIIILTNRVHPTRNNDITELRTQIHKMILNNEL